MTSYNYSSCASKNVAFVSSSVRNADDLADWARGLPVAEVLERNGHGFIPIQPHSLLCLTPVLLSLFHRPWMKQIPFCSGALRNALHALDGSRVLVG